MYPMYVPARPDRPDARPSPLDAAEAAGHSVDYARHILDALASPRRGAAPGAVGELVAVGRWFDALGATRAAGLPELAGQLAEAEFCFERYADAIRHFDRAVASAAAGGRGALLARLLLGRSRTYNAVGRVDAAADDVRTAAAMDVAPHVTAMAGTLRSMVSLWRYGPSRADLSDDAARLTEPVPAWHDTTVMALAYLRFNQARLRESTRLLELAVAGPVPPDEVGWRLPNWYAGIALSLVPTEGPDAARPWAERAGRAAADLGLPGCLGRAAASAAVVALADGDPTAAFGLAMTAVDDMAMAGRRLWLGEAYLFAAQVGAVLGYTATTDALLGRARAIGDGTGAGWLVRKVADERRRGGARLPRPRRQSPPSLTFGLTERERQVALLAARGLTNREIGARLFIGARTVETHLSRTFRKVGVASRAALGLRLAREGDVVPPPTGSR